MLCLRCGMQASHCGGFSCCRAWALGAWTSVVVAHGLSCSAVCGIFPDQGSNPCSLYWQVDSQPLRHQGSLVRKFLIRGKQIRKLSQRMRWRVGRYELLNWTTENVSRWENRQKGWRSPAVSRASVKLKGSGLRWWALGGRWCALVLAERQILKCSGRWNSPRL